MTVFSDLLSDLTNLMGAIQLERETWQTYNDYLEAPPALPSSFADQTAYDAYDTSKTTWTANCASSLATWGSAVTDLDSKMATIIARIPVAETLYTITLGGGTYTVGKFADASGNYNLRINQTGVVVRLLAPGTAVFGTTTPTVTGA